jgi:putative oxidoreductase
VNLFLPSLARWSDLTLFGLRALAGGFLMHETWDNVSSRARMGEFVQFLDQYGFPVPWLLAPLSVAVQFGCGALLVAGLLTRLAGLLIAANFVVAVAMVHFNQPFRDWWPAIVLVSLGLHFAAAGSGKFGLDALVFGSGRRAGR